MVLFFGDLNVVRSVNERKGARERGTQSSEIRGFSFIERNFLVELPIVGNKYTLYKSNGLAKSRLNIVLVYEEWLQKWPMCKQYV